MAVLACIVVACSASLIELDLSTSSLAKTLEWRWADACAQGLLVRLLWLSPQQLPCLYCLLVDSAGSNPNRAEELLTGACACAGSMRRPCAGSSKRFTWESGLQTRCQAEL